MFPLRCCFVQMKFPRKKYGTKFIGYLDFGKKICLAISFGSFFIKPSQVVQKVGFMGLFN